MTDSGTMRTDLFAGLEAGALVLAQRLGLGSSARSSAAWPIDESDPVLSMAIAGEPGSALVLAVNDEVADQLLADAPRLADAFGAAMIAINGAAGTSLTPTTVARAQSPTPQLIAEIVDGDQLTAVVGLMLHSPTSGSGAPAPAAPVTAPTPPAYQPVAFDGGSSATSAHQAAPSSLTVLHDVELVVTAELGRTTMPVRDLLGLTPGMVVEIDRAAGAPIDLLVNGRRIAAGEVVVIDEEFGIRITEIAPTGEHSR